MSRTLFPPRGVPGTKQQISASTTTAKATNAVGAQTDTVYVFNNAAAGVTAYINFGLTGGAATVAAGFPIAGQTGHYLGITRGQFVHAILSSSTGTVDVVEMTA
jgi:hypothetical protein